MNIAIILAGGTGSRLGFNIPKQFFKVAGKTVIEHTIDVFEKNAKIDEIAVVIHELYVSEIENMVLKNDWRKVKKILKGGKERFESSLSAINAYKQFPDHNLIFHDAVRPMVCDRIIDDVVNALELYNAVDVAIPATDTIIQVDDSRSFIKSIPNRFYLQRGQTPQAFKVATIQRAYETALKDSNFQSSDDCGVVAKYLPDEKIYVVRGEESNMKLTYKEDSYLLDKLFQLRSSDLEVNLDLHKLNEKVLVVFGGNSGIGKEVVEKARLFGAVVYSFSRNTTGTDISNRKDVKEALKNVYNNTGRIDFVVNSAAILSKEPLIVMDTNLISDIIRTNFDGMVHVAVESYPFLKESKGQLLLYTSSSYTRGRAFYSLYSSTKAAVVNFMQAIAQEWEIAEIRVNVINPERTKTPMRISNFGNEPDGSLLSAETVAEVSLKTLLSDFTGQVIDIKHKVNCEYE